MKRSRGMLMIVALCITSCARLPTGGAPASKPGERQPRTDLARNTLAIYPAGEGQVLAQTFRPRTRQTLSFLEIPVACTDGVLLNVKIRRGLTGPVLYESNHSGLTGTVDGVFDLLQVFDPAMSSGIELERNVDYAFELSAFPGPGATERTCGLAQSPAGDSYPRGKGYYQDHPINGPGFLPLPDGAPGGNEDLPFRTLVR